ncbi:unnamed protein product, partial [Callosobruchus maculatus]
MSLNKLSDVLPSYEAEHTACLTDIPIIGILSQETHILKNYIGENHHSFIVASYVKFLESAGARVIPIWIGKDDDYYTHVLNYTNG